MYVAPILPTEFLHGPPVFHAPHSTESLRPKPRTLNSQTLNPLDPNLPNAEASSPNPETMLFSIILISFLYYPGIIPILSHYYYYYYYFIQILFLHYPNIPILSQYSYILPIFLYYPIIPILSHYSYIIPLFLYSPIIPIFSHYSYIIPLFLYYPIIPILSHYSYIIPLFLYYPIIPMLSQYSYIIPIPVFLYYHNIPILSQYSHPIIPILSHYSYILPLFLYYPIIPILSQDSYIIPIFLYISNNIPMFRSRSRAWRPWRSLGSHLWRCLAEGFMEVDEHMSYRLNSLKGVM